MNKSYIEIDDDMCAGALLQSLQRGTFLGKSSGDSSVNGNSVSSHDRIVDTAYRMFSERGYDGTSVAAIADESGVNKALIYYYFEDKQALYKEVIDSALSDLLKIWNDAAVLEGDARQRLSAYLYAAAGLMRKNSAIAPLIFAELTQGGELQGYIFANFFLPNAINFISLINDGVEQGQFRKLKNPVPIVPSIMAGLFIVSRMREMGLVHQLPFPVGDGDYAEPYIDYVIKGLSV